VKPGAPKLVTALLLGLAAIGVAPAGASAGDYEDGLVLGQKAFEYGRPLLDMERTYKTSTSVNVPNGRGAGPVNRFSHFRRLTDASDRTVVAPNHDTLYSMAWLDLSRGPQVIHVPPIKGRFYVFELLDMFTENFYNVTSNPRSEPGAGAYGLEQGGDFAVVPPGFKKKLPRGVRRVASPYTRAWVIGRTYVRDASDVRAVRKLQNSYLITPLSRFGQPYSPKKPRKVDSKVNQAAIPGLSEGDDPLELFTALGKALTRFPGPAADQPLLDEVEAIGVGPGLDPAKHPDLSAETLRGMRDAVANGDGELRTLLAQTYVAGFEAHNGYLVGRTGNYGTDYRFRALVDLIGLGAPRSDIALYPIAQTDRALAPLSGHARYVLHVPPGELPPVKAFWSLTLYDLDAFFVPNELDRYLINDRTDLHVNGDGSIDLYVQSTRPTAAAQAMNWLPSPGGKPFRLYWRLYGAGRAIQGIVDGTGWTAPAVQACDSAGVAADGTPCAA
jgi:hypothetical protein